MSDENTETGKAFLSVVEAAAAIGVSPQTIRRMITTGAVPAYKPVPGRVLIDPAELVEAVRKATR